MSDDGLSARLSATLLHNPSLNAVRWLFRPLLGLLAQGRPVGVEDLASATGRSVEEVRAGLAEHRDAELDDDGRIVGNGITLRTTPHRFVVDGVQLYTWCALDTLIFPALLGRPAEVESPSHLSGKPIRVAVDPGGVTKVDPPSAVVSLVTPDASGSIRGSFCNQVHFFADAAEATSWLGQHPGASVVPVTEAFRLGLPLVDAMTEADRAPVVDGADGDREGTARAR